NMIFAVVVSPVPEPTAWGLLIMGIATAGVFRAWKMRWAKLRRTDRERHQSTIVADSPNCRPTRRPCISIASCAGRENNMHRSLSIVAGLACAGLLLAT